MNGNSSAIRFLPAFILIAALLASAPLLADEPALPELAGAGGLAVLAFGFVLGLKHALDADHLVAIGTIVSERRSLGSAVATGTMWGAGHTFSLLAVGILVVGLRLRIPDGMAHGFEFAVALMIVGLGGNLLWRMTRHGGGRYHLHMHSHGPIRHAHPHPHFNDSHGESDATHHWVRSARKPFLVGLVHGLAGSAALMLLVLSEIDDPSLALVYILIFGLGSIGGMAAMSTLFSLPYSIVARRFSGVDHALRLAAGAFSILFGGYMMWEIASGAGWL